MKKMLAGVLLLLFTTVFSQTQRFIYELGIMLNGKEKKMNMVLDIDKDFVKFYDYKFLEMDSISKKTGQKWQANSVSNQLIIRKANSFDNQAFHDNVYDYFVINSTDKMDWKIGTETKKADQYTLQKATTDFGGREWTAWFSTEIPFQEGPYKFKGLPGLIFELSDGNNDFKYKLVKNINIPETQSTLEFLETHYGNKPIPVSLKQYHKVKLDYYSDPVKEMSKSLKNGGTVMISGEKITTQNQLDQKKKHLQEMIKQYYNPIEKDKAIPYPAT
ncbi:GLPGLI family protein [Chryseobacterium gwangjuense]|uniref:GLPGLI family protein n=1 Tax=Chryseobacterium gwangjuense TaxID=1069980 RepID=UPI001E377BAF|nr:GLPGLI family protein [Chryseobacterium gwangjuense]MCE3075702.1 GLPGLI family protein [Chryseobacterium gwangjuense]